MSIKAVNEQGQLVPAPRNLPHELFLDFERQDNEQILAELRGEVVEEYAYQFQQGGQTITGLSLAGVMAVAQQMGGITCGQPVWSVTDDEIVCDISATDHKTGNTVWATASEPRSMHLKNGSTRPDKFARAKALSKAQRNAIHKLIPAALATKMLEMALSQNKPHGRQSSPAPRREPQRLSPSEPPPRAPEPDAIDAEYRETGETAEGTGPHHRAPRKDTVAVYNKAIEANWSRRHLVAWLAAHEVPGDGMDAMNHLTNNQVSELSRDIINKRRPALPEDAELENAPA